MKTSNHHNTHAALARLAPVAAVCWTMPAHAGSIAPSWRFYKPTNTGIPGDWVHTIYLDEQDRPWIAAYTPGRIPGLRRLSVDLDGDCAVGVTDLLMLLANWG